MPLPRLLRFGLRQLAAGMLSVLALGILNRVMKVELGIDLGLVGLVVGAHYFAAPVAVPAGYRSDYRPYFGLHRTPYIVAGAVVTALATVLAPFVAFFMEAQDGSALSVLAGVAVFLCMGAGIYTAGTAYLSLLADLTDERERGKAVAVVWSMLMGGILAGVALGVVVLDHFSPARLVALFVGMAAILLVLTLVAVWGLERPGAARPSEEAASLSEAVGVLTHDRQARVFFAFLFSAILFLFLQQAVLEPFGGDVFAMSVRQTTAFNGSQMVGVLAGMGLGGVWLAKRLGTRPTAALGLIIGAGGFALLTLAAGAGQAALVHPAILVLGLGMGLFNVGGLSLMMGMAAAGRVGLYMGAWTLAQALANGIATIGGGLLHDGTLRLLGSERGAYASVFAVEAAGLLATLALLARIPLSTFPQDAPPTPLEALAEP